MKADIIPMHMINNYGSVLQTYATCEMFRMVGIEPEIIDYYPERLVGYGSLKQLYIDAKPFHKNAIKCLIVAAVNWPSYKLQNRVFKPFIRKHIPLSNRYESMSELESKPPVADIYCTGSDQVWNNFLDANKQFDRAYFLDFGDRKTKRISYAASFGRSDFSDEEKKIINTYLQRYDAISTRDKTGLNIIEKSGVGLQQCCLDPTFMIPREKWTQLAEPIKQKNYILVYQLHEDSATSNIAIELGKELGIEVIRISTALHRRIHGGKTIMLPTVGEFVSYIQKATLVVTDSFHATAFSINLNVPFVSVKWKMFNDRIDTILDIAGLQYRSVKNVDEAKKASQKKIDYDEVNRRIATEKKKSFDFFERAIAYNKKR